MGEVLIFLVIVGAYYGIKKIGEKSEEKRLLNRLLAPDEPNDKSYRGHSGYTEDELRAIARERREILENSRKEVEQEIKLKTSDCYQPFSKWHRAYPKLVSERYQVAFRDNTTIKVPDGEIYIGFKDFHFEVNNFVERIYEENKNLAHNAFRLTSLHSEFDFTLYMAMNTKIFRYIYNEEKYRVIEEAFRVSSRYEKKLYWFGEKIYSNYKCLIDDLRFIEGFSDYVRYMMKRFSLDEPKACGVAWSMLKRVLEEYHLDKWEKEYSMLPTYEGFEDRDADHIIRCYTAIDEDTLSRYETIVTVAYYLMWSSKMSITGFFEPLFL